MKPFPLLLALVAVTASGFAQDKTGQLPGMSQEVAVKSATELGIKAPAGEKVAVIDHSWVAEDTNVSQSPDHHNAWFQLADVTANWPIKVTGKYYIPTDTRVPTQSFRATLRKATSNGLKIFAEKSEKLGDTLGEWIPFSIQLESKGEEGGDAGKFILMLSATPLAGPIYLDDLHVVDSSGNELWDQSSFE